MILGIGTDIAAVSRLARLYARHGEQALRKILAPSEREAFTAARDSGRFLAKRFAAKEALGKALGIGIAPPALLPNMAVAHDALGKPFFHFSPELAAYLAARRAKVHLSISDEKAYALAFVIVETSDEPC